MEFPIIMCCDDKYKQYFLPFFYSLKKYNPDNNFHIYMYSLKHKNISEDTKKDINTIWGDKITYIEDNELEWNYPNRDDLYNYYSISLLRLEIILKADFPKALYIDGDMICTQNIQRIINEDLENYPIGGWYDPGFSKKYFNAGCLLLNLKEIKRYEKNIRKITEAGHYPCYDQDILNIVFENNWKPIKNLQMFIDVYERYQVKDNLCYIKNIDPVFLHYKTFQYQWIYTNFIQDIRRECFSKLDYMYLYLTSYDDDYSKEYLHENLYSIFKYNNHNKLIIYIYSYDDYSMESKRMPYNLSINSNVIIEFIQCNRIFKITKKNKKCSAWNDIVWLRIECILYNFKNIKRIIYVDLDTLCTGDIKRLYYENLDGKILGAWYDLSNFLPEKVSDYFHSAMFIVDVEKFKEAFYAKNINISKYYRFPDQDVLNIVCDNNWKPLNYFGYMVYEERRYQDRNHKAYIEKIIHTPNNDSDRAALFLHYKTILDKGNNSIWIDNIRNETPDQIINGI
jgi:lipopolysaccharide biosynthesis glycosyltransferase